MLCCSFFFTKTTSPGLVPALALSKLAPPPTGPAGECASAAIDG